MYVTNTLNQCIIYSIIQEHVTKEGVITYKAIAVDLNFSFGVNLDFQNLNFLLCPYPEIVTQKCIF